jgi:hypothetical protein
VLCEQHVQMDCKAPAQTTGQIALHEGECEAGGGCQITMHSEDADRDLGGGAYIRAAARAKANSQYGYGQH